MSLVASLEALRAVRQPGDVVIAAMGAAREWMALGSHPLDWIFVPSSMGQATSLGMGLALARPDRRVVVLNGDGGMLMNLGSLVTIGAYAPPNLVILLFDNGVYEVTGAQPTPGAAAGRTDGSTVDFTALARASGIRAVFRFGELGAWTQALPTVLDSGGPTLAVLDVAPVPGARGPRSPGPAPERARAFIAALAARRDIP
jgi:thiamine pyrophosphate-dependent acetolactate synthase large subunit-like protein